MKVRCVALISPVDGMAMTESSWITVGLEYPVLSVITEPGGGVLLQVLMGDDRSAGWFAAAMFITTDAAVPSNWTAHVGEGGVLTLEPDRWRVPEFWEHFYDGDPAARRIFDEELQVILSSCPADPGP
jgi:hypothetical protein